MSAAPTTRPPIDAEAPRAAAGPMAGDDLRDLMHAVNETAERLGRTHATLQKEVLRLRGELAEANAQLRRSRDLAALGEMAAGIAHEIRNPLAAIGLNAQVLAEDLAGAPEPARLCGKIGEAVSRMDAIVRDVLAFATERRITPTPTTARELVERGLRDCRALLTGAGVELRLSTPSPPACALEADECLVAQAIGNVVRNAVEALVESDAEPRRVTVEAARRRVRCPGGATEPRVIISVEDNGPGIPAEQVDRIFNPFYTTRQAGTGLGLAIVHRIVDAHGGHLAVRRGREGGARVDLHLPPHAGARGPEGEHGS